MITESLVDGLVVEGILTVLGIPRGFP